MNWFVICVNYLGTYLSNKLIKLKNVQSILNSYPLSHRYTKERDTFKHIKVKSVRKSEIGSRGPIGQCNQDSFRLD